MHADYLLILAGSLAGVIFANLYLYLRYRRGIALQMGLCLSVLTVNAVLVAFTLGREGFSLVGIGLALAEILVVNISLTLWMLNRLIHPLRHMTGITAAMARGEMHPSIPSGGTGEIGELFQSLHALAEYCQHMSGLMNQVSGGQLVKEITPCSDQDVLGHSFRHMTACLHDFIQRVSKNSASLNSALSQLTDSAQQASQSAGLVSSAMQEIGRGAADQATSIEHTITSVEQVARAIADVAQGAQDQAGAVKKAAGVTYQISATVQQVAESAQSGVTHARQAADIARSGFKAVQDTIQGMQAIQTQVEHSAGKVEEMGLRSQEIGAILETIDDIASQTNLLALNAAIEAARAGEHGQGFAVVAEEVRKLAEKSAAATKEIAGLVRVIQGTVSEAVQAMAESSAEVRQGVVNAGQSGQALGEIRSAVETVTTQVEGIARAAQGIHVSTDELVRVVDAVSAVVEANTAATEEMAAGSKEVAAEIENIASVIGANNAMVEEVSASADEMNAQAMEVIASVQWLSHMAEELQKLESEFRLDCREEDLDLVQAG
ncbi:MAG: HAMP domain-containing protein [Chloroflexi bacterium]|nr:HAMP domain-containing protein [Chloroflexota bacterium]